MYLVSEDEYIMMGKHPEQQARLNAIALQDERKVHVADKLVSPDEDPKTKLDIEKQIFERKLDFHDEKYLHRAPLVALNKDDDDEEKIKWEDVHLEEGKWALLPVALRMKARLLMQFVNKYAGVSDQQEFVHRQKILSGSNIFDLVHWAIKLTRTKNASPPHGWSEFLHFLSINKAIPKSIFSKFTIMELDNYNASKIKSEKLNIEPPSVFETLFPAKKRRGQRHH
jgi:hypothetical protein